MKPCIAITLIVVGAVLVITPALSDMMYQSHVVRLLSQSGAASATLEGRMGDFYSADICS